MDQDFLVVYSDPGQVPTEEFHDWYDHEHVPLRMQFQQFRNGFRFRAADHRTPGWLATYDVDPGFLDTTAYNALRAHRSQREQALVQRLATLDRRIYSLDYEAGRLEGEPRYLILVGLTSNDHDGLIKWYRDEHIPLLTSIEGWNRVRQFRLREGAGEALLTVHDIEHPSLCDTPEWKHATSTPWRTEAMASVTSATRRVFAFHNSGR
ncbi:hypothetical protein [Sinomonas humi]|uniref:EthD domain-containing protein n=1 Tax=Sinomonas humi TaxID=1338436 RepID=A0A0B2ARK2_9MICC|nr:hypothetical protein [Sinomonas humi]KHL04488.1 hypothetical protein LK10_04935 [Sinomonas humi]